MTETKNKNGAARLIIVLFVISAVVALLLGLTNYITKDKIEAIKADKTASAMQEVLPADEYRALTYTGDDSRVTELHEAVSGGVIGHVVRLTVPGSQDMIDMLVGVDAEGCVTGVAIVDMSETAGLGANAEKPEFRAQYVGRSGALAVTKDGGDIDALTGATVTSRAVTNGVNAALAAVGTAAKG